MKQNFPIKVFCLVLCLLIGPMVMAQTIPNVFVNNAIGDDTYDGSSATVGAFPVGPKKTFQAGVNRVDVGGTLTIENAGSYLGEQVTITKSMKLIKSGAGSVQVKSFTINANAMLSAPKPTLADFNSQVVTLKAATFSNLLGDALLLSMPSGAISVESGDYSSATVSIDEPVTISGINTGVSPNSSADLLNANGGRATESNILNTELQVNASQVTIQGMRFEGASRIRLMSASSGGLTVASSIFLNNTGSVGAISCQTPATYSNITINDNRFLTPGSNINAIEPFSASNVTISSNYINGWVIGISLTGTSNANINGNLVAHSGTAAIKVADNCQDVNISYNNFNASNLAAIGTRGDIVIENAGTHTGYMHILNNIFTNSHNCINITNVNPDYSFAVDFKANYNFLYPNTGAAFVNNGTPTSPVLDFTGNWWVNASGPSDNNNAGGTGSSIVENTDEKTAYSPWYNVDPDDLPGRGTAEMGVQIQSAKTFAAYASPAVGLASGVINRAAQLASASNLDEVIINAGTYNETVLITGNIKLRGMSSPTIQNLTMNGTGKTLTVTGAFKVSGALTLTDGLIHTTSTNSITLTNGATANSGSPVSYVDGPLMAERTTVGAYSLSFPIGKNGTGNRAATFSGNLTSGTGIFSAEYFVNGAPSLTIPSSILSNWNPNTNGFGYWQIDNLGGGSFTNGKVSLAYGANDVPSTISGAGLGVAKGTGTSWTDLQTSIYPSIVNSPSGTITSGIPFTSLSPFGVAPLSGCGFNPVPSVSFTSNAGCESPASPTSVTFVNNSSISGGNIQSYTWDWGDASAQTVQNTGPYPPNPGTSHNYTSPGVYTVNLLAQSDLGCSNIYTATVVIKPRPNLTIVSTPTGVCQGSTISFNINITGIPTGESWSLSYNASNTLAPAQVANGTGSGNFTITTSATNGGNSNLTLGTLTNTTTSCSNSTLPNASVIVSPPPTADAPANTSVCNNSTVFVVSGATAANYSSLLWTSTGTGSFSSTSALNPTYTFSSADLASASVTFTLTANGQNGCTAATDNITLTILNTPTVSAGNNATLCQTATGSFGGSVTLGSSSQWTLVNGPAGATINDVMLAGNQTIATGTLNISATAPAGNYVMQLTGTSSGCANSKQVTLVVNPMPAVPTGISITPNPVCLGSNLSLSVTSPVSGVMYQWAGPGSWTATGTNIQRQITNATWTGPYTATATIGACTSASSSATNITINTPPTVDAGNNLRICRGTSGALNGSISFGTAQWTLISGPSGATINDIMTPANQALATGTLTTSSATPTGTYELQLSGTSSGCSATDVVTLNVDGMPAVPSGVTLAPNPVCLGNNLNLSITSPVSGEVYQWSGPGGWSATGSNVSRTITNLSWTGPYTVTATSGVCTSAPSGGSSVTINAAPLVDAGNNVRLCQGSNGSFNGSVSTGTAQWTLISGPSGATINNVMALADQTSATGSITTTSFTPAGTYVMQLSGTLSACVITDQVTLIVDGMPAVPSGIVLAPNPVCLGSNLNLSITTPASGVVYQWAGPGGWSATGSNVQRMITSATWTGPYTVTATSGTCSSAPSGGNNVTINTPPTVDAGNNARLCQGATGVFGGSVSSGNAQWVLVSGPAGATINNVMTIADQSSAAGTVTTSSSTPTGTYTIQLNGTVSGCTANDQVTLVVDAMPAVPSGVTLAPNPVCLGTNLNLSIATPASGVVYQWSGPGSWSATGSNVSRAITNATWTGPYTVTATNGMCTSAPSGGNSVTINTPPTVDAGNNVRLCQGSTGSFAGSVTGGASAQWTLISGPTGATINSVMSVAGQTIASGPITTTSSTPAGSYDLMLTGTQSGCSATDVVTLIVDGMPAVPSGITLSPNPVCLNNNITLSINSPVSGVVYQWSGPGSWSATGSNVQRTITNSSMTGPYTVTATSGTCTSNPSSGNSVTLNVPPTVDAGNNLTICQGTSTSSSGSVSSGSALWTLISGPSGATINSVMTAGNQTIANGTFSTTSSTPTGTYTLQLTGTLNGCSASDQMTLIVDPLPATPTAISITPNPVCLNTNITLSITAPASGITYQWSGPGGWTATGTTVQRLITNVAWTGPYTVTASNGTCTSLASAPQNITINTPPTVDAGNNLDICQNATGILNGSVSAGSAIWTTVSTPAGGSLFSVMTPSAQTVPAGNITTTTTSPAGTYVLRLMGTLNGCSSTDDVTVMVNALPAQPTTTATPDPVCEGDQLNLVVVSPVTGMTYTWNGPGAWSASGNNVFREMSNTSLTGPYTVTSSNGTCVSLPSSPRSVVINPKPQVNAGVDIRVCRGATPQMTTPTIVNGNPTWTLVSGPTITITDVISNPNVIKPFIVSTAPAGTYQLMLTGTGVSPSNCSSTDMMTLVINELPQASITTTPASVCVGSPISFTVDISNVNTEDAWLLFYNASNTTLPSQVINGTGSGTFTFTTTNTIGGNSLIKLNSVSNTSLTPGCVYTILPSATVIVSPQSVAGPVTGAATVCQGTNSGTLVMGAGYIGSVTRWEYSEDAGNTWKNINNFTNAHNFNNLNVTTQYRTIVKSGACAEVGSNSQTITMKPLPQAVISSSKTICAGTTANLDVTVYNVQGQPWSLNFLEGTTTRNLTGTGVGTFTLTTQTLTQTSDITLINMATTGGSPTCATNALTGDITAAVQVTPIPKATLSGSQLICDGKIPEVEVVIDNLNQNHNWTLNWLEGANSKSLVGTGPGKFLLNTSALSLPPSQVVYSMTSITNSSTLPSCTNSTLPGTHAVNIAPNPIVSAGNDTTISIGYPAYLEAIGGVAYLWTPANTLSNPLVFNPVANPTDPSTTYKVVAWDINGCLDSDEVVVNVTQDFNVFIPNFITPNGDGKNDYFVIPQIKYYPTAELIIFNRYGKELYRQKNYQNNWDGGDLPDGTYFYVLHIRGLPKEYKGDINIVRSK